jgi:hypothetical protein
VYTKKREMEIPQKAGLRPNRRDYVLIEGKVTAKRCSKLTGMGDFVFLEESVETGTG